MNILCTPWAYLGIFFSDSIDYCKLRPLRVEGNRLATVHPGQSDGELLCTSSSFDFDKAPRQYCSPGYDEVYYAPFPMNQTFVTEFGLICSDQYMVLSSLTT